MGPGEEELVNSMREESPPRVLLALDGSPAAATALPLARTVADQLGAFLEVFHVASPTGPEADLWQRLQLDLRDGEEVQVRSHAGEPSKAILEAARARAIELVVLTTH